jgi:hypothetical protein
VLGISENRAFSSPALLGCTRLGASHGNTRKLNVQPTEAGYGKAGKQEPLSNFPAAATPTKYIQHQSGNSQTVGALQILHPDCISIHRGVIQGRHIERRDDVFGAHQPQQMQQVHRLCAEGVNFAENQTPSRTTFTLNKPENE